MIICIFERENKEENVYKREKAKKKLLEKKGGNRERNFFLSKLSIL